MSSTYNQPSARRTYDHALLLQASTTDTSTDASTPLNFDVRAGSFDVVVDVSAITADDGDETYVFSVDVSDASGGTYTKVVALPNIRAIGTGRYVIAVDAALVQKLDADAEYIKVTATLGGTTPSITWSAFIAPRP